MRPHARRPSARGRSTRLRLHALALTGALAAGGLLGAGCYDVHPNGYAGCVQSNPWCWGDEKKKCYFEHGCTYCVCEEPGQSKAPPGRVTADELNKLNKLDKR